MEIAPNLVYSPHPLLAAANRKLLYAPFVPGESLAIWLSRLGITIGAHPVILALNDRIVPRDQWGAAFPQEGDIVTIRATIQGGGEGGSNPLRTVLTIALLIAAPQAGAFLAWGTGVPAAVGTALTIVGGTLIIDRLAPLPKPPRPGESPAASPTYSLAGAGNRARPYEPLPLVLGTHRIYPDLGAKPYTEFRGNDQYLYLVFNFGLSDVVLSDFKIGDTPIADFDGVEIQESGPDGALTLFPANVDTLAGGALTAAAGWITKTSSTAATALAVDISGLLFYSGNDGLQPRGVNLEIEYRAVGAGTWVPFLDSPSFGIPTWSANTYIGTARRNITGSGAIAIPTTFNGHYYRRTTRIQGTGEVGDQSYTYTGSSEPSWPLTSGTFVQDGSAFSTGGDDPVTLVPGWEEVGTLSASNVYIQNGSRAPVRKTYRRNVPSGQYEVRVRRISGDETDDRAVSDMTWESLKTYQPDTTDYTGQKRIAIIVKASGQLQGALDTFNAIASARTLAWNGSAWVLQATSNPAWWWLWFARGKSIGGRRAFGALLPDSRLDLEAIKAFGAYCTSKNLTFDAVLDRVTNCREVLDLIARCGRGATTTATGKFGAVWDAANQPVVQVFGMGNIKRNSFQVEYITGKLADEIVVNFINPALNWQQDTVRVPVAGALNPSRPAVVDLFGCKNKDMAGAEANLIAAAQVWRRRRISWESDFEGMVSQRGDVVVLSHDLTQWGYSGRLLGGNGVTLQLERKVPFTPLTQHYIGITFPNGYYQIFDVQIAVGETDTIILTEAWPAVDDLGNALYTPDTDPNHPPFDYKFVFDPKATPGKKVKILDIKPLSESYVRLTATDEEPTYYAAESASYTYAPPAVFEAALPTITNVTITDTLIVVGGGYATRIAIAFNVSGTYGFATVRAGLAGMPLQTVGQTDERRFEFTAPPSGVMDIEITARAPSYHFKAAGRYTTQYVILGKDRLPQNVQNFSGSQNGRFIIYRWDEVSDVDRDGYEIRRAPAGIADTAEAWRRGVLVVEAEQGTEMTTGVVPPGNWTHLIKAKDTSGNFSATAARFDLEVTNALDIIQQKQQAPDWLGTKTNFLVHWTGKLVPESTKLASQHTREELFEQFVPYPYATCSYEATEIDLGFDSDARVWADIQAQLGRGRSGIVDTPLSIDYRLAAGAYDGFEPWSIGDVRARYIKQKFTLDTSLGCCYVSSMNAVVDSEEFDQSGTFISAIGGVTITFPEPFHVLSDFQITPEGAATAYTATYENLSTTGAKGHVWRVSDATEIAGVNARWSAKGV